MAALSINRRSAFLMLLSAPLCATPTLAQTWPARPVRVIVPIAAGSGIDVVARIVADRLSQQLGVSFYVENRPGGATTTGSAVVAREPADGHTILFNSAAFTITPATVASIQYDVQRDFAAIAPATNTPLVMLAPPGKFKSLKDLVDRAKREQGGMNYAMVGYGGATHLVSERLRLSAGFDARAVPYRGTSEALTDLMADRISFYFSPLTAAASLIKDGKLDALATTSVSRIPDLPDVPTTLELGYPESDFEFWVGMFVAKNTPRDIVDRLYAETRKAVEHPSVIARFAAIGGVPMPRMSPSEFDAYVAKELDRNRGIAREAGVTPQ